MKRALDLIIVHRRGFTLGATVFMSVLMMMMGEGSKTRFARAVTTTVLNTGKFTFSWAIYMTDLWRENRDLRRRNLELSSRINLHDTAVRENKRLRHMLGFKERYPLGDSLIAATVIGRDLDRAVNSLILGVGHSDGVRKNMTVVTAEGLVGRIFHQYPTSSSVQIIMDTNARVSAMVGDDIYGIVSWRGGPDLVMYGLPRQKIPEPGMKVYTTGFGLYPEGILIGTVVDKPVIDVELYATVRVRSAVDFSRLHEVFIIRGSERADIWDDGDGTGPFIRPEIQ